MATGTLATPSYDGTVAGRAPALLRLAHQLTGDPATAIAVAAAALSRRRVRRAVAGGDDQAVVAALVHAVLECGPVVVTTTSPLDALSRRTRIAVVLAFATEWDAAGIAEALHVSLRRAHAEVTSVLSARSEESWRALLAQPRWDLPA